MTEFTSKERTMEIIEDRQALHRIPELDKDLPETVCYLHGVLENFKCDIFSPIPSSICAFFDFGREDAIAFRSDADALPICEQTGAPYASQHPGKMHACGHDGHMAIALELARRLNEKKELPHNVLIVFQPAEETTGGARDLCKTGIFEKYHVQAIFGLHLWPGLEKGTVFSRANELMARSCEVKADIYGKTAHIAKAAEGLDALEAGARFYLRALEMEREIPKGIYRLLKFGKFESGRVCNAISDLTHMEGSLRAFQDDVFFGMREKLLAIGEKIETESGCTVRIHMNDGYPAVMNPKELYERVRQAAPFRELDAPTMTAEDFSWYQQYLPGMFFLLGVGDTPALHSDRFDFDEQVLLKGADFFEKLAENFL